VGDGRPCLNCTLFGHKRFVWWLHIAGLIAQTKKSSNCRYINEQNIYGRGHQHDARGHLVARKHYVGCPRASFKNSIKMMCVITYININNDNIIGKLNKIFISEVCIKLVALRVTRYPRSSSQLHKGWWPLIYGNRRKNVGTGEVTI